MTPQDKKLLQTYYKAVDHMAIAGDKFQEDPKLKLVQIRITEDELDIIQRSLDLFYTKHFGGI